MVLQEFLLKDNIRNGNHVAGDQKTKGITK